VKRFILILSVLVLASCASTPRVGHIPETRGDYVTASWYGPKFNGRPTSSGERFDMYAMTAAHKKLKFGTKLRVTNPENNKSVIVTVNDRGPFIRGRDLDLSYGAAKKIGLVEKGVGRVKIERVGRDIRYVKRIPFIPDRTSGVVNIQVASFIDMSSAFRLKKGLEVKYKNVFVTRATIKGEQYYRVKIGKFKRHKKALAVAKQLADEGYDVFIDTD
jgi:rare lipoprotein A